MNIMPIELHNADKKKPEPNFRILTKAEVRSITKVTEHHEVFYWNGNYWEKLEYSFFTRDINDTVFITLENNPIVFHGHWVVDTKNGIVSQGTRYPGSVAGYYLACSYFATKVVNLTGEVFLDSNEMMAKYRTLCYFENQAGFVRKRLVYEKPDQLLV